MMRVIPSVCLALAAVVLLIPGSAAAQSPPDAQALQAQIDQLKKEFGDRIAALEAQLAAAQAPQPAAQAPQPAAQAAPETVAQVAATDPGTTSQVAASNAKVFNPDTSVIGNFLSTAGRNEVAPSRALEMREAEASFQ